MSDNNAADLKNELDNIKGKEDIPDVSEQTPEQQKDLISTDPNDPDVERTMRIESRNGKLYKVVTQWILIGNQKDIKEPTANELRQTLLGKQKLDEEPKT
jgi:hypothetical protein